MTSKIFDTGSFQVFKIEAKAGEMFPIKLPKADKTIHLNAKGGCELHIEGEYFCTGYPGDNCVDVADNHGKYESYDFIQREFGSCDFKALGDTVNYCISSNYKNNAHTVIGEVNKYSKGETVTFDTDYILIADGSVSIGNNKYNTDTVLSKPKTVTITQDCVIASFNVRKK